MEINRLLNEIKNNAALSEDGHYKVVPLPDLSHKLGCSTNGHPKFFVKVSDAGGMVKNLNAEILSVEYDMLCDIIEGNKQVGSQRFTIITLHSDNEQLQKMFVDVFIMMLHTLPEYPTKLQLASKIENLLTIFSKLKRHSVHKLQGLWSEMLVIEQSIDPTTVAKAWHSSPESKYDFTIGGDKLEVKSTSGESRVHRFSLDQLNPTENSSLIVCSVIVRESAKDENGLSVFDLYDKLSSKIADDETRLHIYEVMANTLGSDFNAASKKFFDYISACDSLALFEGDDIPKIEKSLIPELITEVKFSANLSYLADIRNKGYNRDNNTLFLALY